MGEVEAASSVLAVESSLVALEAAAASVAWTESERVRFIREEMPALAFSRAVGSCLLAFS